MKPLRVIKTNITGQPLPCLVDRPVIMKINCLVFNGPPEPLNKDVVIEPTAAIHTNSTIGFLRPEGRAVSALCEVILAVGTFNDLLPPTDPSEGDAMLAHNISRPDHLQTYLFFGPLAQHRSSSSLKPYFSEVPSNCIRNQFPQFHHGTAGRTLF
jgi:hypothetical protein